MRKVPASIAISLLAAVMLGCLFYTSGCSESQANAEEILTRAVTQFSGAKSYHMQMDGSLEMTSNGPVKDAQLSSLLPLKLTLSGQADMDIRDPEQIKLKIYDLSIGGLAEAVSKADSLGGNGAQRALTAGMFSQMLNGMELVIIKDTFYMKMTGMWFKISANDIPSSNGVDFGCLFNISGQESGVSSISGDYLKDIEELPQEDLDGVTTRHFKASLDGSKMADQVSQSFADLQKCGFDQKTSGVGGDAYSGIDDVKKFYQILYDRMRIEYWVDSDLKVHRMALSISANFGEMMAAMGEAPDQEIEPLNFSFVITADISHQGEDFEISAPENALPLKDILNDGTETAAPTKRQAG